MSKCVKLIQLIVQMQKRIYQKKLNVKARYVHSMSYITGSLPHSIELAHIFFVSKPLIYHYRYR